MSWSSSRATSNWRGLRSASVAVALGLFAACFAEQPPDKDRSSTSGGRGSVKHEGGRGGAESAGASSGGVAGQDDTPAATGGAEPAAEGGSAAGGAPITQESCPAVSAEKLPARRAITSANGSHPTGGRRVLTVTKESLFKDFEKQTCGLSGCHGGADKPLAESPEAFKVTLDSFGKRPDLGTLVLERVLSSNASKVMPPGSGDGSTRGPEDPVRVLGERLKKWQDLGFPTSFDIELDADPVENPDANPYVMSPELGDALTNIGSCIPRAAAMLNGAESELRAKDEMFAALATSDDLPDGLADTDLVSLDSAVLAQQRVISYAPTYPLFSDHSGKMRHVRVPLGESIHYDPALADFVIPDNTRFYKTFFKPVKDKEGKLGYRKMETRLIVVRRDEALPDGHFKVRALRASYAWNKDETMARRVKDPLRNGKPAADRLCPYVDDESVARDPIGNPISDQTSSEFCEYMTASEMKGPESGRVRHYAIPGTERCDQCHMGSPGHSYVLGFNPWQVDRRADGEGGVYEAPTQDELGQLQRFVDYGVVTGIEPGEAKLEDSQGERKPRNEHELKAQAYMLGNCAFCHNPNGFPVVQNPSLREFDLYPSKSGGAFQFPLERYSPRAKAGASQKVRFPYITPAFGDFDLSNDPGQVTQVTKDLSFVGNSPVIDGTGHPPDYNRSTGAFTFLGPWRSLIWRNVYTPFTYQEDSTIFVHMPRNVTGYDCRAPSIMANWMLSIVAAPKPDTLPLSERDQPYMEVTRDNAQPVVYRDALLAVEDRMKRYPQSVTGQNCPTDDDIVDPKVILSPHESGTTRKERGSPQDDGVWNSPRLVADFPYELKDRVPDHAHFIPTDTTDPPGRWIPRRSNWKSVLVTREVPVSDKIARVVDELQSIHLSQAQRDFSLERMPTGLWHDKCASSTEAIASPTVDTMTKEAAGKPMRRWLGGTVFSSDRRAPPEAHVHLQSRGEAVFRQICQNCHGRDADSKSPLAATILELTGGQTRVANFIDGLFGPASAPGAFARQEFLADAGATPEDWQVRYLLFMGLGGTEAVLPQVVLSLVATSPFYGQAVTTAGYTKDPNMLESAAQLCLAVLAQERELKESPRIYGSATSFAKGTGHYELWESLCTYGNQPVVRVFSADTFHTNSFSVYRAVNEDGALVYPLTAPVGTSTGSVELGIAATNTMPWCFEALSDAERSKVLAWAATSGIPESMAPFCPPELLAESLGQRVHRLAFKAGQVDAEAPLGNQEFTARWARRGAMNAGIAAFEYLRGVTSGSFTPSKPFDFCLE